MDSDEGSDDDPNDHACVAGLELRGELRRRERVGVARDGAVLLREERLGEEIERCAATGDEVFERLTVGGGELFARTPPEAYRTMCSLDCSSSAYSPAVSAILAVSRLRRFNGSALGASSRTRASMTARTCTSSVGTSASAHRPLRSSSMARATKRSIQPA